MVVAQEVSLETAGIDSVIMVLYHPCHSWLTLTNFWLQAPISGVADDAVHM